MTNTTNIRDEDLILYIASELKNCASFGSIMLNKVLYYSDNLHYLKFGHSISNFKYVNRDFGPTPEPVAFFAVQRNLIKEGKIKEEIFDGIIRNKKKIVALKPSSKKLFTKDELKIIDEVIENFKSQTAYELSDKSHTELGWQLTKVGEEIPYNAFLLNIPELKEEDYIWATDELKKVRNNCA